MGTLFSQKRSTWFFCLFVVVLMGSAFACNFSPVTPVPQTPTATVLLPTSTVTTPPSPATLPPATLVPTADPCIDNAINRTEGCDEFTLQIEEVRRFDSSGVAQTACQGWCQLREGDALETNSTGQAELNFSDCWPGRLFLYQASIAQTTVSACTKADFCPGGNCSNPPAMCVPNGALYADKCAGEFNPVTGSTRVEKTSASYLITYQRDSGDITTIVVMEGVVRLRPVLSFEPLRLGDPVEVQSGQFIFTMPDESLRGVSGLEPRVAHSVEQLPQVVQELGLQEWMIQAAENAREGGNLPETWPPELSSRGIIVRTGGGSLSSREVQNWTYSSINWNDVPVLDRQIFVYVQDEPLDALSIPYSEIRATVIMIPEMVVQLVFLADDDELEKAAGVIADYLRRAGVAVELIPVQAADLTTLIREYEAKKRPYMVLTH